MAGSKINLRGEFFVKRIAVLTSAGDAPGGVKLPVAQKAIVYVRVFIMCFSIRINYGFAGQPVISVD